MHPGVLSLGLYKLGVQWKGMMKMNGQRIVRKHLRRLTTEELQGLWQEVKDDTTVEGMVIYYLTTIEMERRKLPNRFQIDSK